MFNIEQEIRKQTALYRKVMRLDERPVEYHDFRDTGNALEKNHPEPDWRNWPKRDDDVRGGR